MIARDKLQPYPAGLERLSPNHSPRPPSVRGIACIVLHCTADGGSEEGAESWLASPKSRVSAHLHIRRDGTVVRLVDDRVQAWHAGASVWRGKPRVNQFSLGWEIANRNDGEERYTDAQCASVAKLAAHYVRQGLQLEDFVSHAEIATPAGRKTDPLGWDWTRFRLLTRALLTPPIILPAPMPTPEDDEEESQPGDEDAPAIRIVPDVDDHDNDGLPDWMEDAADTAVPVTPAAPAIASQVPIHVVQPAVKPGRKSSELKGFGVAVLAGLGYVFAFPDPIVAASAALSIGAASLGYSLSRGQAKSVVTFVADAVQAHQERTRRKP